LADAEEGGFSREWGAGDAAAETTGVGSVTTRATGVANRDLAIIHLGELDWEAAA
jgi:hypothetical protein